MPKARDIPRWAPRTEGEECGAQTHPPNKGRPVFAQFLFYVVRVPFPTAIGRYYYFEVCAVGRSLPQAYAQAAAAAGKNNKKLK